MTIKTLERFYRSTPFQIATGISIVLVASALLLVIRPIKVVQTCQAKEAQLHTVAGIANATGYLPGDPVNHFRTKYAVRPNLCK